MRVVVTYSPFEVIIMALVIFLLGGFCFRLGEHVLDLWDIYRDEHRD